MEAIVTGATGFIGSWLTQELLRQGDHVTLVVRNKDKILPEIANNRSVVIIEKDITNLKEQDFRDSKYDVCYNLAWTGVAPEQKNNLTLQLHNIETAAHLLDVIASLNCSRFISSGTVAEYVFCDDIINVNAHQTPNDIYGAAKVSAHYILDVKARQLQIPFNWIIIPSTYGERRTDNNIITYTIRSLLDGKKPVYGNLEQMWDFLYVGDVVRAIRLIGEKGNSNKVYGIGSGDYRPLKDYIVKIRDLINPELELGIGEIPAKSVATFSSCVNIYDLVKDTGFSPMISFDEGIIKTINWFSQQQ